ncbi:hypothetical protein TRFO_01231 [Tritrichomonas foetus]|uniref:EF-hand domain-containing protein n=1 Tax=Tritrichomonas foetus TaxID=1144522 RepID=A0A1J4KBQ6_9EUKA|nr:hypothetical protein TRFO_01231 [Tritrichomonas foetus]|eukprot:OHT07132.1 hypothetical protein TRFO_01231 [Tritrichomonas foetus]
MEIQGKLSRLGATNRSRWSCFSPDTELTQSQFNQRLSSIGINVPPHDVATLWRATGILSETMQFSDFIRFLQAESISLPNSSPSSSSSYNSLIDSMKSNTRSVLMKFIEFDPSTTGTVTHRTFSDICSWFATNDDQTAIRQILNQYDPQNTGDMNYFYFLGDLCSNTSYAAGGISRNANNNQSSYKPPSLEVNFENQRNESPLNSPSAYAKPTSPYAPTSPKGSMGNYDFYRERNNYDSPIRNAYDSPSRNAYDNPRSPLSGNSPSYDKYDNYEKNHDRNYEWNYDQNYGGYDNYNDANYSSPSSNRRGNNYNSPLSYRSPPGSANSQYNNYNSSNNSPTPERRTTSGGRGRLDPAIFGESGPSRSPIGSGSPGGRHRLDPSIFGQKPQLEATPEQPVKHADDYVNADHIQGLTPGQLIELISKQVSRVSRGSKQCYSRWRGSHEHLDANDLRDGLARDANIVIPLRDLQLIVNQYGGPMNMSAFVRMLGDGSKFALENSSIDGMRRSTEDEAALIRIADQVIGTQWEDMIFRSRSAEDIVRGFAMIGVNTTENDIRTLTSKYGLMGFVDAIKARIV